MSPISPAPPSLLFEHPQRYSHTSCLLRALLRAGWLADPSVLGPGSAGIWMGAPVAYEPALALQVGRRESQRSDRRRRDVSNKKCRESSSFGGYSQLCWRVQLVPV